MPSEVSFVDSFYSLYYLQQSVPPIMAFHLGSLGFLTPFKFENFQEQVTNVLEGTSGHFYYRYTCICPVKSNLV